MSVLNAVQIVESFWADVWVARNPEAIDCYVVDDFVITSAGRRFDQETPSRTAPIQASALLGGTERLGYQRTSC